MSTITGFDEKTNGWNKAIVQKMGGVAIADAFLRGEYVLTKVAQATQNLLKPISTIFVPATTQKFIAGENFKISIKGNASVKIRYLENNFVDWFLLGNGKTECPRGDTTLRYAKLRKFSVDGPIIAELGGEAKAETALSEVFSLMKKQKNGEGGVLLNNGYANIFYIKDQNDALRAVTVNWSGDGWSVKAASVDHSSEWDASNLVFSRN